MNTTSVKSSCYFDLFYYLRKAYTCDFLKDSTFVLKWSFRFFGVLSAVVQDRLSAFQDKFVLFRVFEKMNYSVSGSISFALLRTFIR